MSDPNDLIIDVTEAFDEVILDAEEENALRSEHDDWPDRADLIEWYISARTDGVRALRDKVVEIVRDHTTY